MIEQYIEFLNNNGYSDRFQIEIVQITSTNPISNETFNINIHYPKFDIIDKNNKQITIYDLIVKFVFDNNKLSGIQGLRLTYDIKDILNNFAHPYLNGIQNLFSSFCLGTSSLPTYFRYLSIEDFELFLFEFEAYLKWSQSDNDESRPYRAIEKIDNNVSVEGYNSALIATEKEILEIISNLDSNLLNFNYVSNNSKLNTYYLEILFDNNVDILSKYLKENNLFQAYCINGMYYSEYKHVSSPDSNLTKKMKKLAFPINNKIINFSLKESKAELPILEKETNVNVIKQIIEKLNQIVNNIITDNLKNKKIEYKEFKRKFYKEGISQ